MLNPSKGCHCGCGGKTRISKRTGVLNKFILHHNTKGVVEKRPGWKGGIIQDPSGYIKVYAPFHPRSSKKHVFEHILIAEMILGKHLPRNYEIHHYGRKNENNKIIICQDHAYHHLLEMRQRAYSACGNSSFRKCRFCHQYDDLKNLYSNGNDTFHRSCRNIDYKERKGENAKRKYV